MFLLSFVIFFRFPIDPDLGWHLRWGEYILNTREVPWYSNFSYNLQNYKVADFYWLNEVVMYLFCSALGLLGLSVAYSLFSALSIALPVTILGKRISYISEVIVTVLLSVLLSPVFLGVRPIAISTLFFSILVVLLWLFLLGRGLKYLLPLPFLFAVWANFHPEFNFGLYLFLAVLLSETSLRLLYFMSHRKVPIILGYESTKALFGAYIVLLLSFLATLINPYGKFLWATIFRDADSFHLNVIAEWLPLNNNASYFYWYYVLFVSLVIVILVLKRKALLTTYLLAVLFLLVLSIRFSYLIRILGILSLPVLINYLNLETFVGRFIHIYVPKLVRLFVFAYVFLVGVYLIVLQLSFFLDSEKALSGTYPYRAVEYLRKHKEIRGNMFNEYGWGGYLIWKFPEQKPFIYGQMPAWRGTTNEVFIRTYKDVMGVSSKAGEIIREYKIDYFLIDSKSALSKALSSNNFWRKVYEDDLAVIFVRTAPW